MSSAVEPLTLSRGKSQNLQELHEFSTYIRIFLVLFITFHQLFIRKGFKSRKNICENIAV